MNFIRILSLILCLGVNPSFQHGRLMEPPSRASMWRLGFPTPKDQNDNECYCGGFGVQHHQNHGRCGICGDPWHKEVKDHEAPGGLFANGIITKVYKQGSFIPVVVDLTANHQGYFEFKICPNDDIFQDPDQSCFDRHGSLWVGGGDPAHNHRRHPITDYETGLRLVYVRLPLNVTCDQCILQWTYVAGNNWGVCDDGTSGNGCGPQETFRGCADISITPNPILSSLIDGDFQQSDDDDEEEEVYDGSVYETNDVDADTESFNVIEEKEALLRRKKLLLQKVLRQLRTLINEAEINSAAEKNIRDNVKKKEEERDKEEKSENFKKNRNSEKNEKISFSQILPISENRNFNTENEPRSKNRDRDFETENEPRSNQGAAIPWWERIMSNRH